MTFKSFYVCLNWLYLISLFPPFLFNGDIITFYTAFIDGLYEASVFYVFDMTILPLFIFGEKSLFSKFIEVSYRKDMICL